MFSPSHKTLLALTPWLIASLIALIVSTFSSTVAHAMPLSQFTGQNLQVVDRLGGRTTDVVVKGKYAYTFVEDQLIVLDVSNPTTPVKLGSLSFFPDPQDVAVTNDFLYVATGIGLYIFSISDPFYPVLVGSFNTFQGMRSIAVQGHYAYMLGTNPDMTESLQVVDVTRPASPMVVGRYTDPLLINNVSSFLALQGDYAYVVGALNNDLLIINISNPGNPQFVNYLEATFSFGTLHTTDLVVVGGTVYISYQVYETATNPGYSGLEAVDVSNPLDLKRRIVISSSKESFEGIAALGNYIYWGGKKDPVVGTAIEIINVADPERPIVEKTLDIRSSSFVIAENHLYSASLDKGLQIFDLSALLTPTLLSSSNAGGISGNFTDIRIQNNFLYATGNESVLQVIDLAAPRSIIGSLAVSGSIFTLDHNTAYLTWFEERNEVGPCSGIHAVDITNPLSPTLTFSYQLGCSGYSAEPYWLKAIAEGRLYAASISGQLYEFDLTTSVTPTLLGTYESSGNAMIVNGNYAYLADWSTGIKILDVSAAPTFVGTYPTIGFVLQFAVTNHYLLASTSSTLYILDIANPTAPVEMSTIPGLNIFWLDWYPDELAVAGDYVYVHAGYAEVRVFDINDPTQPTEVAFYNGPWDIQTKLAAASHKLYATGDPDLYHGLFTLQLTGAIAGKVVDSFGKPYAGMKVTLNSTQTIETDAQGNYSFASLTPGEYKVKIESPTYNFQPAERVLRVPSYSSTSIHFTAVPKPVTTAVTPAAPANLSFTDLQGNAINLNLPAGSVEQPTNLNLLPEVATAAPGLFFTGVHFDLQATQADNLSFMLPVTVTVHYTDSAVAPISDKNQLALRWWNGNQWVAASTTCPSAIPAQHDLQNQVISTAICQTGHFALFGPTQQNFLPLITRASLASDILRGRFVAQHSGKCLNVQAESQANGANVIQWPCGNTDNETWIVQPQGEYVQLIAKHSRKCLSVNGASQAEGAPVVQWSCSGGDNELWRLRSDDGSVSNKQIFQIAAKHSNQCLTVQGAAKEDSAQLVQSNCSGADHQLWQLQTSN